MYKARYKRSKRLHIDMAAMCDVALLILCFFIVTSRFEQWEPLKINSPSTVYPNYFDAYNGRWNEGIIYLKGDKAMFQVGGDSVMRLALGEMAKKYGVHFSPEEKMKFTQCPIIGAPMAQLKQYDDQYLDWENSVKRPGIPYINNDELYDWILDARIANKVVNNTSIYFVIKADKDVKYANIKKVLDQLRKQKINRISMQIDDRNLVD